MIKTIQNRKRISFFLCTIIIFQVIIPVNSFGLTSGPNQPEFSGFQSMGNADNVDLFSGDFNYSIPIYEIGGYPLNLSYKSGAGVEEEAGWVGLGWELSTGMISRNVRGVPDDFKRDEIKKEITMKDNFTIGLTPGVTAELFGFTVGLSGGLFYNNYNGFGIEASVNPSTGTNIKGVELDLGLSYNSQRGIDVTTGLNLGAVEGKGMFKNVSFVGGYNSRQGLKSINLVASPDRRSPNSPIRNTSASISINPINYTPVPNISYETTMVSLSALAGVEFIGLITGLRLKGYFQNQQLAVKEFSNPSYGTLYSEYSKEDPDALMDFNEDQHKPYQMEAPSMSPVIGTYDIFNVSSSLLQGQFRAHRNDVGFFYNPESRTTSVEVSVSAEIGGGNAVHSGADLGTTASFANKGIWDENNFAKQNFKFTEKNIAYPRYEPSYLKMSGELHLGDELYKEKYITSSAAGIKLEKIGGSNVIAAKQYVAENHLIAHSTKTISDNLAGSTSAKISRNKNISYLTNFESIAHGLNPTIKYYPFNTFANSGCAVDSTIENIISKTSRPAHHISEISITDESGTHFKFGIPVYNNVYKEMTFSTNVNSSIDNLVTYSPSEASKNNKSGRDNYYSLEEKPPYSTAFLLTEILSHDYYDRTGDGISFDDTGTALKFNYSRTENYKWRFPITSGSLQGRFNPGYRTDPTDNKVSVVYGERENWYPHSIESNLEILRFYTSDRNDALGVGGMHGSADSNQRMKKLDSIVIYSKSDLSLLGAEAIPLRTIVFEYQDTGAGVAKQLARYIPNVNDINEGKLVLKGIYTKYKNNATKYNKYDFSYNTSYQYGGNTYYYNYTHNSADRWGNFKIDNSASEPYELDYPYVFQDPDHAAISAYAFNINTIKLPSGGELKIEYESDDYAFVQDKRAGQMIKIKGFTALDNNTITNELYSGNDYGNVNNINSYVVFDLLHPVPFEDIKTSYFQDVEKIYFNVFMDLTGAGKYEYVSGYLNYDINSITAVSTSGGLVTTAKVKLLNFTTKDNKKIHPVTKAGNQLLRTDLQNVVLNSNINSSGKPIDVIKSILGPISSDIGSIILGFDKVSVNRSYNKTVNLSQSWIRLANPNFKKYGGGARVKSISLEDNWSEMDNYSQSSIIKQEYIYETNHTIDGVEQSISSGVASWEPALGGEENLHKNPMPYTEERMLAPTNYHYIEKPTGEMLFPNPSVGYSEVKVKNITARTNLSSNGYTVYKFYTARDFPTISRITSKNRIPVISLPQLAFFISFKYINENASQGFVIETNDMHGKQKEVLNYNDYGDLVSGTIYEYRVKMGADGKYVLDNQVSVIFPDGTKSEKEIGADIDIWQSFNQEKTDTYSAGVAVNFDGFFIGIFPIPVAVGIPTLHANYTTLRTSVTTKHVQRTGILSKVTYIKNGSSITSENLYFDSETGSPLITKTQNEFNEPHYQTTYPAHWAYEGMGIASHNQDIITPRFGFNLNGEISTAFAIDFLNEGDEVLLYRHIEGLFGVSVDIPISGDFYIGSDGNARFVIDKEGSNFHDNNFYRAKILKPGSKNLHSNSIYQMKSLDDPMGGQVINVPFNKRYLDISVQTYKSDWQIDNISKRENICVIDDMEGDTIFSKLVDVLISTDDFWDARDVDLLSILHTVYSSQSDVVWRGNLLSETLYFSLFPGLGIDQNMYQYYYATVGDCLFSITRYDCPQLRSGKLEISKVPEPNPENYDPNDCVVFNIDSLIMSECYGYNGSGIVLGNDNIHCKYIALLTCNNCVESTECVILEEGDKFNPFNKGMLNKWHPYESFVHHANRNYNSNPISVVNAEGAFNPGANFWTLQNGKFQPNPNPTNWIATHTNTKIDRRGSLIESMNAIYIPGSVIFGYGNNVQKSVANNSKLRNIAMECFEDWDFKSDCIENACYEDEHFDFFSEVNLPRRNSQYAHTGKYSIAVIPSTPVSECRIIKPYDDNGLKYELINNEYRFKENGALPKFTPEYNDSKYVVSAWMRKGGQNSSGELQVKINNTSCCAASGSTITLSPSGPVIEGWQRIYGIIELPAGAPCPDNTNSIEFIFKSNMGGCLFDDFRFHPLKSSMQTYVYDHQYMRISAILDENNYATFYEYDDAGQLIRMKKETEKGIMTLQEGRKRLITEN